MKSQQKQRVEIRVTGISEEKKIAKMKTNHKSKPNSLELFLNYINHIYIICYVGEIISYTFQHYFLIYGLAHHMSLSIS